MNEEISRCDRGDSVYASPEAVTLHRTCVVFDCLSLDYILEPQYSSRALEGGVTATNMTVALEGESWDEVLRRIDEAHVKIHNNPDLILAVCADDVRQAKVCGKLAVILGTQGADFVGRQLWRLRILHELGLRYIGLAYTGATLFADGCGERRNAGLSFLGQDFVAAVNDVPLILDLSHTGHQSRLEAARLAIHPVCTHSNAYAVNPNDRNTTDEVARIIAEKGGVMGVTALVKSVAPADANIEHMLDHADHWMRVIGPGHVGLGLDFTEGFQEAHKAGKATMMPPKWRKLRPDIFGTTEEFYTQEYPSGLRSIRQLPNFTQGLLERRYSPEHIKEIVGGAWLRQLEAVTA